MGRLHDAVRKRVAGERGPTFKPGAWRVAMTYPSPYRAGMSSLGYQRITMLLREAGFAAERVFLPDDPKLHRAQSISPFSYETETPLNQFPILAVSLAYELELAGLFELLTLANIPVRREDRTHHDPVILLGGPITMASPLAAAPFVDAILLGEAEQTVTAAVGAFFDAESNEAWLDAVSALPGGYVPQRDGTHVPAIAKSPPHLLPARSSWLCPDAELSDMFLIEGERGCHRQCTFCVMRRTTNGGMRVVASPEVVELVPEEAHKVGLVGAAISDHPQLVEILEALVEQGKQVSLSSLRADQIWRKPDIARLLRASGAKTLTVASDGASERLRKELKKGTTEKHLRSCAEQVSALGFDIFKVYMIVGLPGETDEDLDELIAFTKELAEIASPARVALGVAPLVGKRHTPLDGVPFAGIKTIEKRLKRLAKGLKGVAQVRPVSARWAWVEHELAQGGPEMGEAYYQAWLEGGRFAQIRAAFAAVEESTRRPWAHSAVASK